MFDSSDVLDYSSHCPLKLVVLMGLLEVKIQNNWQTKINMSLPCYNNSTEGVSCYQVPKFRSGHHHSANRQSQRHSNNANRRIQNWNGTQPTKSQKNTTCWSGVPPCTPTSFNESARQKLSHQDYTDSPKSTRIESLWILGSPYSLGGRASVLQMCWRTLGCREELLISMFVCFVIFVGWVPFQFSVGGGV